jgi:N-[(2S)-2-amino-2-carboxyethyl]-L-glutamate dehydrogenase
MPDQRLLFLSRDDIARLTVGSHELYVEAIEHCLRMHAAGRFAQPLKPYLKWRGPENHIADRIIAMPAYLGGDEPIAGIKWIGSKHDNPSRLGLERASALTILNDAESHYPIAILEAGLLSRLRTAAVTVVATRHLARAAFTDLACIGSGPVGQTQVDMLLAHFPAIRRVHLFDLDRGAAERQAGSLRHGVEPHVASSAEAAVLAADVVVTATVTAQPYLSYAWLRPGALLNNVSIMDAEEDVFLRADKVVVDDWDQCNREKKVIHRLVESGRFSRTQLHAELGQIVAGERPGRETDQEVIVVNPMGMAIGDIACARAVYSRALRTGVGTWLTPF